MVLLGLDPGVWSMKRSTPVLLDKPCSSRWPMGAVVRGGGAMEALVELGDLRRGVGEGEWGVGRERYLGSPCARGTEEGGLSW